MTKKPKPSKPAQKKPKKTPKPAARKRVPAMQPIKPAKPAKEPKRPRLVKPSKPQDAPKTPAEIDAEAKAGGSKFYDPPVRLLELGPIALPAESDALNVLRELGELNDELLQAENRHKASAERTKALKGEWTDLAEQLSKRLRLATHADSLPLFDQAEREVAMAKATENQIPPEDPGTGLPLDGPIEGSGEAAEAVPAVDDAPGEAIPPPVAEDEIPF